MFWVSLRWAWVSGGNEAAGNVQPVGSICSGVLAPLKPFWLLPKVVTSCRCIWAQLSWEWLGGFADSTFNNSAIIWGKPKCQGQRWDFWILDDNWEIQLTSLRKYCMHIKENFFSAIRCSFLHGLDSWSGSRRPKPSGSTVSKGD